MEKFRCFGENFGDMVIYLMFPKSGVVKISIPMNSSIFPKIKAGEQ